MAILSNINGKFAVESSGAIQLSGSAGTSGYVLKSNGTGSAASWVDPTTIIGGPYLPLSGGTLTGATATASGISFTVGGNLIGTTATFTGNVTLSSTGAATFSIENTNASQTWGQYVGSNDDYVFRDFTDSRSTLVLHGDGNATFAGNIVSTGATITLDSSGSAGYIADRANDTSGATYEYKTNGSLKWYTGLRGVSTEDLYIFNNVQGSTALLFNSSNNNATFTGNVLISSNGDATQLQIKRASANQDNGLQLQDQNGNKHAIFNLEGSVTNNLQIASSAQILFHTSSDCANPPTSERMRIDSSGNVGIGTDSPTAKLEIVGSNGTNIFRGNFAGSADIFMGFDNANPYLLLQDNSNVTTHLFISNVDNYIVGSNLGIGYTSPAAKLHVGSTGTNAYSATITKGSNMKGIINTLSNNADDMVGIYFATGTTTEGTHWSGITGSRSDNANHWGTQLNFYTHNNDVANLNDATQKMVIKGDGNVGVGTTSPATKLDVEGTIRATQITNPTSGTGAELLYNPSVNTGYVLAYDRTNSAYKNFRVVGSEVQIEAAGTEIGKFNVVFSTLTNSDSGPYLYTNPNGRLLTSNASGWFADGRDPILTLSSSGNSNNTNIGNSIGLNLHNNSNVNGTFGPLITFSSLSESTSYNTAFAAIGGVKRGRGPDTNWSVGDLCFWVTGPAASNPASYMQSTPSMVIATGGNVGIGVSGPSQSLEISGNMAVRDTHKIYFNHNTNTNRYIGASSHNDLDIAADDDINYRSNYNRFFNGGTEFARLSGSTDSWIGNGSNGQLGIGKTNPAYALDVNGGIASTGTNVSFATAPLSWQANGNTGTYTQTVIYANQSNSSGIINNAAVFIERGRLTNSATGEIRHLIIGSRGGQSQFTFASEKLGINNDSPSAQLHLTANASNSVPFKLQGHNSTSVEQMLIYTGQSAGTGWYNIVAQAGGINQLIIYGNGNIQNANNSYGQISDERLKENIVDTTPKLEDIKKIKVKNFNFIGDDLKQIGMIAQEVEEVFPGLVEEIKQPDVDDVEGGTYKSIKYSVLVPILIKAIQELEARVKELENK